MIQASYNVKASIDSKDLAGLLELAEKVEATVNIEKKECYAQFLFGTASLLSAFGVPFLLMINFERIHDLVLSLVACFFLLFSGYCFFEAYKHRKTLRTERRVLKKLFEMSNGVKEAALDTNDTEISIVQQALLEMRLSRIDWRA